MRGVRVPRLNARMRVAATAAWVLVAIAAGGCGGDGRREAMDVADRWLRAVGERDAEGACELMRRSAVSAIRQKYTGLPEESDCRLVVRVYADAFDPGDVEAIRKEGLEVARGVRDDEIGVFPAAAEFEDEVILMRRADGKWRVASTSVDP